MSTGTVPATAPVAKPTGPTVEELSGHIAARDRTMQDLLQTMGVKTVEEAKRVLKERKEAPKPPVEPPPEPVDDGAPELPDQDDKKYLDPETGDFRSAEFRRDTKETMRKIAQWDREQATREHNEKAVDGHMTTAIGQFPEPWRGEVEGWTSNEDVLTVVTRGLAYHISEGEPPTAEQIGAARGVVQKFGEKIARAIIAGEDAKAAEAAAGRSPHPGPAKPGSTTTPEQKPFGRPGMSPEDFEEAMRQKLKRSRET